MQQPFWSNAAVKLPSSRTSHSHLIWSLLIVGLAYGLYQAVSLAWTCDDAFISFRYAKNFVDGHGLVFNAGERVEGYTNFLWTILIACGMFFKLDPKGFTHVVGISSYLLTVAVFVSLSMIVSKSRGSNDVVMFPLAALSLLVFHDFHVFATSGLETAWVTALVSGGFALLVVGQSRRVMFYAGLLLIAAVLSRPDAIIFYLCAIPFILLTRNGNRNDIFRYLLPALVIFIPYWILRYAYYGHPFPNTYYAKSIAIPYYTQGLVYLWMYMKTYYVLLLLPLGILLLVRRFNMGRLWRGHEWSMFDRAWILGLLFIASYAVFVVRIGGDFMFARLLIPVTPIAFYLIEISILNTFRKRIHVFAIALILLAGVTMRWNQFVPEKTIVNHIANEPDFYPSSAVERARMQGEKLRRCLADLDVTVGFYSSKAMLMYYSGVPTAIECDAGLTDEYTAHLPLAKRGRPGHEKKTPIEYILDRRTSFMFSYNLPNRTIYDRLRLISFDGVSGHMPAYNRDVMRKLRERPEVTFVDFEMLLDEYIENLDSIPASRLRDDAMFFRSFYFEYNDDPIRQAAIESRINVYLAASTESDQ